MAFSRLIDRLRRRLCDVLIGANFRGSGAAATALVAADGRLIRLGPGASAHLAEAAAARDFASIFMGEDRAAVASALRSRAVRRLEARARRPGGSAGAFEIHFEHRPDGAISVLMIDRTAEKRVADARALEAERSRGADLGEAAMLADLSHEMRTPLNAVIGFAETIEQQTFGPVGHENYAQYAEHIRMAGRHLLDLVNAVLDLSKIEADRYKLQRVAVDPAAIANECAGIISHSAEAAGLRLRLDIASDCGECRLDPRAVRQILLNLLSNAVKFTDAGEIALTLRRDGDNVVFTVKDDGVGMSAEALSKIGARFTRAQGAGVRGQGGAGLGLSLAMRLAELHGGDVKLASAPGEGLTAEVRLPIEAPLSRNDARPAIAVDAVAATEIEAEEPAILTQLDRIEAYRRERAGKANAA